MSEPHVRTIWPPYEAFYIRSMLFNAESAARSVVQVNVVMHAVMESSPEDPVSALPVQYLLTELQNIIIQAGALSRYFWPTSSAHEWRGAQLRKAFSISEDSPLRSRELRNAIEHFDEQLDRYLENGVVGHILPEFVGLFREPEGVPVCLFRAYYVDIGVFELLGKKYEVQPLATEVTRIHEQLKKMDGEGGRLQQRDAKK